MINLWTKTKAWIFFLGMIIYATLDAALICLSFWLPMTFRQALMNSWGHFMAWWSRIMCNIDATIIGADNIPKDRPFIVVSNHESAWETSALLNYFPPLCPVVKRELIKLPVFGWGLRVMQAISVDRSNPDIALKNLVEQGQACLDKHRNVLIFPQGTRVGAGEEGKYNLGAAALAYATGYPILPVIHNSGDLWPRRSLIKKPGTITTVVGPLIEPEGLNARQIHKRYKQWMLATRKSLMNNE